MKKILQISLGTSFVLALVFNAIFLNVFDLSRYEEHYLDTQMDQQLNLPYQSIVESTAVLFAYVKDDRTDMDLNIEINGQTETYFNQREVDHMVDVKALYLKAHFVYLFSLSVAGLSTLLLFLLKMLRMKQLKESLLYGLMIVGALLMSIGFYAAMDFQAFWITFHKLLFSNDLWLLNPLTDRMIVMFTLDFFMNLVFDILGTILLGLGITIGLLFHTTLYKVQLNSRFFKNFALGVMTLDHIGHFIFPEYIFLRVIGRLAFPIFTFLFAKSARYTHDRKRLLIQLSLAAIVGQGLIYVSGASELVSIFFLFVAGLLSFMALDAKKAYLIIPLFLLVEYFHVDYGAYGLLVLLSFYVFNNAFIKQALAYALITLFFTFKPLLDPSLWPMIPLIIADFTSVYWRYFVQALSILAMIPLAFYCEDKPKAYRAPYSSFEKFFFYAYYPLHIALLAILRGLS